MSDYLARAVVYEAPKAFMIREYPLPNLGPGDLLVEVLLAGVDGSELHMFRGEFDWLNDRAPVIFGDEIVGRVAAIGSRVLASRGLNVGDLVTVESTWPCNDCYYCLERRQYYRCEKRGRDGYGVRSSADSPHLWGGYATHVFVPPEALVYRIPDGLPTKAALFACSVLANGLHWTEIGDVQAGSTVAVIGPGPQGLACVLAAAEAHARVVSIGLARDAKRLEGAKSLGAIATVAIHPTDTVMDTIAAVSSAVGPVDVVIETAGTPSAKELALKLPRPMGTVVHVAVPFPRVQPFDYGEFLQKAVRMLIGISHPYYVDRSLQLAKELLGKGIDVGALVTHTFPLERAEEAIHVASYETSEVPLKVVLDPQMEVI